MGTVSEILKRKLTCIFDKKGAVIIPEGFTVTAHAGAMHTPANTLESIQAGFDSGADIIEFDLNTNAAGVGVLEHTYPEKAKNTLKEAFELISTLPGLQVNIDVKNTGCLPEVQELAEKYGLFDRIFYTGIGEDRVEDVLAKSPSVRYYINCSPEKGVENAEQLCEKVRSLGALGINAYFGTLTPEVIAAAHRKGLTVSAWTVNTKKDMRFVLAMGVDNITTLYPDKLRRLIARNGQ